MKISAGTLVITKPDGTWRFMNESELGGWLDAFPPDERARLNHLLPRILYMFFPISQRHLSPMFVDLNQVLRSLDIELVP